MRTLCFGGSFNPIHHGHLICARSAAEAGGYDRILLIPSGQPPHKGGTVDLAAPADRLAMCRLAVRDMPLFQVSDIEICRPGPSYTIETVRALRRQGWTEVHWLIGADMLLYLPKWHSPLDLIREAKLLVMARPGWRFDWGALAVDYRYLERNVVAVPQIDIGATEIRRRVAEGRSVDYLVPDAVRAYVMEKELYLPQVGGMRPPRGAE